MTLLKYLLFALVVGTLLKFIPNLRLDDNKILGIVLTTTLIFFVVDNIGSNNQLEGMMSIVENDNQWGVPDEYTFRHREEDYSKTGLTYDTNEPGNPLLQEGQFDDVLGTNDIKQAVRQQTNSALGSIDYYKPGCTYPSGISYKLAPKTIKNSVLEDLYSQRNTNIKWSPHTHIGKARGYLNWDPNY